MFPNNRCLAGQQTSYRCMAACSLQPVGGPRDAGPSAEAQRLCTTAASLGRVLGSNEAVRLGAKG